MAYVPNSNSVVAFQSNPSVLQTLTGLMSTNASVFTVQGNQSVSGTVQVDVRGSVATVIIGGSIAASFTPPANQSVSGTVNTLPLGTIVTSLVSTIPSSVLVGASIFGQLPAGTATIGSVAALQATNPWIMTGSVQGVFSVIGTLPVTQSGGWNVSIASTVPSSVIVGASIFGQLPAGTAMLGSVVTYQGAVWNVAGSVAATVTNANLNVSGSVVAFQGAGWSGSVAAVQLGTRMTSVVSANPSSLLAGVFAQRNDTVSSFLGGNLTWTPLGTDSAGRILTKPFSSEDGTIISYVGSIVSGSVQLIQASAIGKKNYITDFWISNTGAATTLVTFQGGDTSVVGQFIAPTGGGMSSPGLAIPLKTTLSQDLAFKVSPSSSVLYVTLKGYQAP